MKRIVLSLLCSTLLACGAHGDKGSPCSNTNDCASGYVCSNQICSVHMIALEPIPAAPPSSSPITEPVLTQPTEPQPPEEAPEAPAEPEPAPEPVEVTPPETTLYDLPALTNRKVIPRRLSSNDPNASFRCSLNGSDFSACDEEQTIGPLTAGTHTFAASAVDASGNADASPATGVTVITTKPMLRFNFDTDLSSDGELASMNLVKGFFPGGPQPTVSGGKAVFSASAIQALSVSDLTTTPFGESGEGTVTFWYTDTGSTSQCQLAGFSGETTHGINVMRDVDGHVQLCVTLAGGSPTCTKSAGTFASDGLGVTLRWTPEGSGTRFDLYVGTYESLIPTITQTSPIPKLIAGNTKTFAFGLGCKGNFDYLRLYDAAFSNEDLCEQVWGGSLNGKACAPTY